MKARMKRSDEAWDPDAAVESFREHGALWLESALPVELIAQLRDAYSRRYTSLGKTKLGKRFAAVGDKRFMVTVKVKPPFDSPSLFANPTLMPIFHQLLGPDCIISSFGSVVALPGADAQDIHFDYPPLYQSEETCAMLPPHAITMVVPLIDLDESTGSTAIWEGSHRQVGSRDLLRRLSNESSTEGSTMPLAKAGDVYLMDFRLIHAGAENRSDRPRPILYIVYSRPWFCEDMNFDEQPSIRISSKRLKKIPTEHRHLFARATLDDKSKV